MKAFLFLPLIFACMPMLAQETTDYGIYLKSGRHETDPSLFPLAAQPGEAVNGKYFRLVQFHRLPDQHEKNAMVERGVDFIEYIPNYTYIVSLPEGADPVTLLRELTIRTLMPVPVPFKIHPVLQEGSFPSYMIAGQGKIRVNVLCYDEDAAEQVTRALQTIGQVDRSPVSRRLLEVTILQSQLEAVASLSGVHWIEPCEPPAEPENLPGRTSHRSNAIAVDYGGGRNYTGNGVIVAMGDDGIIGPHIDYQGRTNQNAVVVNNGNHGDHVAGTIMGAGNKDPLARGMAFGATLYVYQVWNAINNSPNSYVSPGVRITSTSYSNGCNAGYTSFAQEVDQQTRQNLSLVHVFSAGNSGTSDCNYGAGSGWGNVTGGVKVGKNVVTVANVTSVDNLSSSSSRGPAHDGRIKPDVAAVGTSVNSTVDVHNYAVFSGTSMACPGTSGTLAQLYDAYRQHNGGADPASGLMKAILMNTADDIGNPGPDYKHGYGRINGLRAARVIEQADYISASVSQNGSNVHTISVPSGTQELKLMLYWTDYEGSVMASKALVNDLDLVVVDPSSTNWQPWVLDPTPVVANLNANATRKTDTLNNAEQVTLQNPAAGTYTIQVAGTAIPQGPQPYFITWEILTDSVTLIYPAGGEAFVPGETQLIRWDAYGSTGTFTLEYSVNNGSSWTTITSTAAGTVRSWNWNVPASLTGQALIRVTRNGLSDVSDAVFSIMNIPANLSVDWACPDSIKLSWSSLANASLYEVSMLGNMYMDSIATTTGTSIVIYNQNPFVDHWFSVKAYGPNGAIGRRAIAINKAPGLVNCSVALDAAVNDMTAPPGLIQSCHAQAPQPVTIEVENSGQNSISNIPVFYTINNGTPFSDTITSTLAPGATILHTFTTPAVFSGAGFFTIKTWSGYTNDGNPYNDTITRLYQVLGGSVVSAPWTEDFESFVLCSTSSGCEAVSCALTNDWINIPNLQGDDIDWRTDEDGTPSGSTGPGTDHNPGLSTGNYLYLEATDCFNKTGQLLTPCMDLSSALDPELKFWYHMYGNDMGDLHVDVFHQGAWINDVMTTISGNQGNQWKQAVVDLSAYAGDTITVRFRGVTGNNYRSDIAIDDINLIDNSVVAAGFLHSNPACAIQPVTFMDQSSGPSLTYQWNFGPMATPQTATTAGPHNVSFSQAGLHTVQLIVSGLTGADTLSMQVQVSDVPSAGFTWTTGSNPYTVTFNDQSSGTATYHWIFGDGNTSNWINPTHTFSGNGPFTVMQIVSNDCGSDTATVTIDFTGLQTVKGDAGIEVYPNPVSGGQLMIRFRDYTGRAVVNLLDITGRLILQQESSVTGGEVVPLVVSGISPGVYLVNIRGEALNENVRVVVK